MRIPLRRPSPALVISCIALTIALGGTSYATVLAVPKNSVGTDQLKNGAVKNKKIADNAVNSAKVQNGTLTKSDFKSGSLPAGPVGPVGPAGPTGPAGPAGLSGVERVEVTSASNSLTSKTANIPCPAGKRLVGGGTRVNPANIAGVGISQSFPDNDNIFRGAAREIVANASNWSITVFGVCATAS